MDSSTHAISPLRQRMIDDGAAVCPPPRRGAIRRLQKSRRANERPTRERRMARAARSELGRTQTRRHPGIGAVGPVGTVPKRRDAEDGQTLQR
jgi:hypothetical protein